MNFQLCAPLTGTFAANGICSIPNESRHSRTKRRTQCHPRLADAILLATLYAKTLSLRLWERRGTFFLWSRLRVWDTPNSSGAPSSSQGYIYWKSIKPTITSANKHEILVRKMPRYRYAHYAAASWLFTSRGRAKACDATHALGNVTWVWVPQVLVHNKLAISIVLLGEWHIRFLLCCRPRPSNRTLRSFTESYDLQAWFLALPSRVAT